MAKNKKPKTGDTKGQQPPLSPKLAAVAAKLPKNWYIIEMHIVKPGDKKK